MPWRVWLGTKIWSYWSHQDIPLFARQHIGVLRLGGEVSGSWVQFLQHDQLGVKLFLEMEKGERMIKKSVRRCRAYIILNSEIGETRKLLRYFSFLSWMKIRRRPSRIPNRPSLASQERCSRLRFIESFNQQTCPKKIKKIVYWNQVSHFINIQSYTHEVFENLR